MSINVKTLEASASPKRHPSSFHRVPGGFSLVELLIVMAIAGMLLALSAPALLEVGPSRKAATMELTGFLERARTRALAGSEPVYVAFAGPTHPDENLRFRAYGFFTGDTQGREMDSLLERPLRQVSEWMTLPEGVFFGSAELFETDPAYSFRTLHDLPTTRSFPVSASREAEFSFLVFDGSGKVTFPSLVEADALNLAVTEGVLNSSGNGVVRAGGRESSGAPRAELISIDPYSGRSTILTD